MLQQHVKIGHFKKVGMRSPKELLTLPSVETHFGDSAVGAKIPGNHVPLEYMAIPSLLSRFEVRKYHFNFASRYGTGHTIS